MPPEPLSLYVHIPFCTLKCSYCDFNSYAGIEGLMRPFVDALCEEMRQWGGVMRRLEAPRRGDPFGSAQDRLPPEADPLRGKDPRLHSRRRRVETVFFGGGTPSLLPLVEVERIMRAMRESFDVDASAEVSFEANPGTVHLAYLRGLGSLGVNRISFGVESFHDEELAALDRIHSGEEAKEAYRWAREAGFQRINLDLIYGLPEPSTPPVPSATLRTGPREPQDEGEKASSQDGRALRDAASLRFAAPRGERGMERWQSTLEQAIALTPEHLSLYALTVEEGTKLAHDIERGRAPAPDGDMQAEMYEWSCERLATAGYRQYEISNWSRPGQECRHNLVYWRNEEWLGLGPGAHSQLRVGSWGLKVEHGGAGRAPVAYRFADVYSPKRYIGLVRDTVGQSAIRDQRSAAGDLTPLLRSMRQVAFVEEQTAEMAMADTAILGLRLNEGLDVGEFERRFGRRLEEVYGQVLGETVALGLLARENGRVRLTERGRLLANEVFVRLLAD